MILNSIIRFRLAFAMVLAKAGKFPDRERNVTTFEVERYNYEIYDRSEDQLYSNDLAYLRDLVSMGKHMLAP